MAKSEEDINKSTYCFSDIADGSGGMGGGHNLRCGEDDEEEDNVGGDNFYENKVAKGIIRKADFVWYAHNSLLQIDVL